MYTVKQIASKLSVTPDAVRHYTRIGIVSPIRDPDNGYRYYTNNDARIINFVRKAKVYGLTLNEIIEIINTSLKGDTPCKRVYEMVEKHHEETRSKIIELQEFEKRLKNALLNWEIEDTGEGVCGSECEYKKEVICPLIENN